MTSGEALMRCGWFAAGASMAAFVATNPDVLAHYLSWQDTLSNQVHPLGEEQRKKWIAETGGFLMGQANAMRALASRIAAQEGESLPGGEPEPEGLVHV